ISRPIVITIVKEKTSWINIPVCLQSDRKALPSYSLIDYDTILSTNLRSNICIRLLNDICNF
ncbi:hypothetical protein, partial [Streptococcus agalactiae]